MVVLWTSISLFIWPVPLQSFNNMGCLCLKDSCCFNASSPFLSSSGLILSECRWGQLNPKGHEPALPLLDQVGPQGEMVSQAERGGGEEKERTKMCMFYSKKWCNCNDGCLLIAIISIVLDI